MQYQFRDATFKGKTFRYIKAFNFDSDGYEVAPVDELIKISNYIEQQEPDIDVIIMAGASSTIGEINLPKLNEYKRLYPRMRDEYYNWETAVFEQA